MAISDSRSAIVTGLASVLVSTSNGVLRSSMQDISGAWGMHGAASGMHGTGAWGMHGAASGMKQEAQRLSLGLGQVRSDQWGLEKRRHHH